MITGAAVALVGGVAAVLSVEYGWIRGGGRVGPGFVPGVSASIMAAYGTAITVCGVVRSAADEDPGTDGAAPAGPLPDEADPRERPRDLGSTLQVLGLMLAAIYAMQWLGFLISFSILSFLLVGVVDREGWIRAAAYAVAVGVTTWIVFDVTLGVPLPPGTLLR